MRKLNTYVHAVGEGADGETLSQVFGPDDEVPSWAQKAITNPDVWDSPDDAALQLAPSAAELLERPKGNASRDSWAAYAAQEGVELEDDMTRDDIIAAVDLSKE
jgi:hypothetical protein